MPGAFRGRHAVHDANQLQASEEDIMELSRVQDNLSNKYLLELYSVEAIDFPMKRGGKGKETIPLSLVRFRHCLICFHIT